MKQHQTAEEDKHRIPDKYLPDGVGPGWFDPKVLRAAATAHLHTPVPMMQIRPWTVLTLLDAYEETDKHKEAVRIKDVALNSLPVETISAVALGVGASYRGVRLDPRHVKLLYPGRGPHFITEQFIRRTDPATLQAALIQLMEKGVSALTITREDHAQANEATRDASNEAGDAGVEDR